MITNKNTFIVLFAVPTSTFIERHISLSKTDVFLLLLQMYISHGMCQLLFELEHYSFITVL